jgi:DNA-binding SARP family transcriptional activator
LTTTVQARPEVVVLGAVGVRCGGTLHRPTSGLSRALLALLAEAGPWGVAEDRLEDVVWGERISRSTVTVAMHRLRSWLRTAAANAIDIRRTSAGYALTPDDLVTDIARFRAMAAKAASRQPRERAATLGEALSLWQGVALADVPADRADPAVAARLAREFCAATLARGEALLAAGEPATAAQVLEALAELRPFDESVHARLVDALSRTGRQAEAITAFHTIRARLREEFGVNPGPELDAALGRTLRTDERSSTPVPAELPLDVTGFTGRDAEIAALTAAAADHRAVVVVGMGGVGKTHLALHWAHRAAPRFPDGQLHADLRGYAEEPPARPVEVLRRFLRVLGTPDERIPERVEDAAAVYRSLLHGRQVLVVLDNAADAHQVRPLLPGAPDCRTIVTGRGGLDGLVAVDGAARLGLDVLAEADAVRLLRQSVGSARADAEPAAVRALAEACGFLPLALRVAALRFTTSGTKSLAAYAKRLRQHGSLAELVIDGDPRANVGACLDHSYRRLPPHTRRVLRLLGAAPGPDLTAEKTAALAGLTNALAQREIDRLVGAQLLTRTAGRYTLPDLVREHVRAVSHRRAAAG